MKTKIIVLALAAIFAVALSVQAKPIAIYPAAIQKVSTSKLLMKIISDEMVKYCKAKGGAHCASMNDAAFFSMLVRSPVFTSDLGVKAAKEGGASGIKAQVALLKKAASGSAKSFELSEAHKVVDKVYVKDLGVAADTLLYGEYIYAKALGIPMEALAKVQGVLSAQQIEEWLTAAKDSPEAGDSHSGGGSAGGGNFTMPSVAGALNSVAACIMAAKSGGKGFNSGLPGGGVSDPSPNGFGDPNGPGGGWNGGPDDKPNANGKGVQGTSSGGYTSSFMGDCFGLDPAKTGGWVSEEPDVVKPSDVSSLESGDIVRVTGEPGEIEETTYEVTGEWSGSNGSKGYFITKTKIYSGTPEYLQSTNIDPNFQELANELNKSIGNGAIVEVDKTGGDHYGGKKKYAGGDSFDPESNGGECNSSATAVADCILGSVDKLGGCYDGSDSSNWAKVQEFGKGMCGGGGGGDPAQYFDYAGWDVTDPSPMSVEILKDTISEYGAGSFEATSFAADVLK